MKKRIPIFILCLCFNFSFGQLNADFTWCPEPDSTGQLCCIRFENLSTDTGGTITSYFYVFGDGQESTLMEPRHCYVQLGTYIITLFVTDNLGNVDTAMHSLTITHLDTAGCNCDSLIGVNEISVKNFSVSTSPSPFHDKTILTLHAQRNKILSAAEIRIYNSIGVEVRTEKYIPNQRQEMILERKTLSPGIYYFEIISDGVQQANPGKLVIE